MGRRRRAGGRAQIVLVTIVLAASVCVPAEARTPRSSSPRTSDAHVVEMIRALGRIQRDQLGIPKSFFPFLDDDAKVRSGRQLYGEPAPDVNGDSMPEVLETDLRYSYTVPDRTQQLLGTVESDVNTRIAVRAGTTGKKLWGKRFGRDAWPVPMRVGQNGRQGVLVISGLWNFYGTTEESTLTFAAFDGRHGKHLWSRSFTSTSYYGLLTSVRQDAPIMIALFDGLEGRAEDLMLGLATQVSAVLTSTMSTRVVALDGADGAEHLHPSVDIGINWWPIPLPTNDLDGDGLQDYATTNNFGIDPGEGQEEPSYGGTVYTRRGVDGLPIWTTSGLEMAIWAFPVRLPDVVADRTPDLALSTYVPKEIDPLIPVDTTLLFGVAHEERVYLFEGRFGTERWHKPREWIYSPGDIDGNGKDDLMLGSFKMSFQKGKTTFDQLAVDGDGDRIWQRRSMWRFETAPCPKGLCFGGFGYYLDASADIQPDRIDDVLFGQDVSQNGAFDDSITRVYDGRTGRMTFEDEADLQTAGTAVDGRGSDLISFEPKNNKMLVTVRDGSDNDPLWSGMLGGPDELLPRKSWFWAQGFELPGDRCGDLVITGGEKDQYFYGVFDGADGRLMWWKWTGPKDQHPTFTERADRNSSC